MLVIADVFIKESSVEPTNEIFICLCSTRNLIGSGAAYVPWAIYYYN